MQQDGSEASENRSWWGWGSASTSSGHLATSGSSSAPSSSSSGAFTPIFPAWRNDIMRQVTIRDSLQRRSFLDLVRQQNLFLKERTVMKERNLALEKEVLHLKQLIAELKRSEQDGPPEEGEKRLKQELAECYKRNSENAQELLELNRKVNELTEIAASKQDQLTTTERLNEGLKIELRERVATLNILTDELEALRDKLSRAEKRNKELEEENTLMIRRVHQKVSEEARLVNEANQLLTQLQKNSRNQSTSRDDGSVNEQPIPGEGSRRPMTGSSVPRRVLTRIRAHSGDVTTVAYHPHGHCLASGSTDATIKVWLSNQSNDLRAEPNLQSTLSGAKMAITQVKFSPSGELILASSCDNMARLWTTSNAKIKHTLTGHVAKVMGTTFASPEKVITGSQDRTIKIWDLAKGYCVRTVFCYSPCLSVEIAGGETTRLLCSAHNDRRLRLWDPKTGDHVAEIADAHAKQATAISWTPACEYYVLTIAPDNSAQLFDLRNHQVANTLRPPQGVVLGSQACFSGDGNFVAAGTTTGGLLVWNAHTTELEAHLNEGHQAAVMSCTWGAKGKPLVTGGADASLLLWA